MIKLLLAPIVFIVRLLWQTVFLAIGQVWANKIRAVLTALGIIIGVLGVTVVAAGLDGMQGYVLNQFEDIGAKKMWLWGNVPDDKRSVMSWSDVKITTYEANLILEHAENIDTLTPGCRSNWTVANGKKVSQGVRVTGIWPAWHEIENRQVIYGRPFSRIDDDENRQVCLINEQGIEELNLDTDPERYNDIIHTRQHEDRMDTLGKVRGAGLKVCCGGIVGMNESRPERAGLIASLANLDPQPESVPINQLVKVAGTPLAEAEDLDWTEFVRTIAVARITMPQSYVRLSAGRANMPEAMQAMCFLAGANSIFYGDKLLTTENPEEDGDRMLMDKLDLRPLQHQPQA